MAKDWKEVLLRSGVPLEYEVACIMANEGFYLQADFPYLRRDGSEEKEHSVDLLASWFGEQSKDRKNKFALNILVECKHRSRDKTLLLLPDPDVNMGTMIMGGTVYAHDEFVPFYLKGNCFYELESTFPVAYKGIEIHSGEAVERDFRRGIEQLRYATPPALLHAFEFCLSGHESDCHPVFLTKVLVTNAPMRLLHEDVDVGKIQAAKTIEDVSEEIDGAILVSDYGPDYERHFRNVFGEEKRFLQDWGKALEKYVKMNGKKLDFMGSPKRFMADICTGRRGSYKEASTQFFVSNVEGLGELAREILKRCKDAYRGRDAKERTYKTVRRG